jgi:uncharacterized protein YciI
MKRLPLLIFMLISGFAFSQNPKYDETLAKKYGADEYGMKAFTLVLLKTGSYDEKDKTKRDSLFAGHMANINRLVEMKKMIVAGPLFKNEQNYRGIFILDETDPEKIKELMAADPTIKTGIFEPIYIKWYGSAALPAYLEVNDKIWQKNP